MVEKFKSKLESESESESGSGSEPEMRRTGVICDSRLQFSGENTNRHNNRKVTVSAADLQAYQIRSSGGGNGGSLGGSVVMAAASSGSLHAPHAVVEEASRKREVRLLKNREAARECRRKKKEYIKCLENRVAVLENQNKALIEELKALKELYCQKSVD